jgi:L-lactate dehydrogenase complex protein LldE
MSAAARPYPPKPAEVYFFGTCLVDLVYPDAGLAAVELIEREGVRVIFPQGQTCCGQPAFNSGYRREARDVARAQLALFPKPIPIVVPSGSCGAMFAVHYPDLFDAKDGAAKGGAAEPYAPRASARAAEHAQARALAARVFEWSDFLVHVLRVRLEDRGPPCSVTYHPSCHLVRELGVTDAPLALLRQLKHVELRPLPEAEQCCGFGGTFSVKQAAISEAMVADKCACIRETGADVLVSMDAGCLMNIAGALEKARTAQPTVTAQPPTAAQPSGFASSGTPPFTPATRPARAPVRAMPLPAFLKERVHGA